MIHTARAPGSLALLALLALGGCLQTDYETTLYPDGSGKMNVQISIRQAALQRLRQQTGRPGELPMDELNAVLRQIQKPENLREYVDGIVGWKPIRVEEDATWLRASYTVYFDDINKLQVHGDKTLTGGERQLVFSWRLVKSSDGTSSLYQITGLRGLPAFKVRPGDQAEGRALADRVKTAIDDFRVSLKVNVPGPIKEAKGVLETSDRAAGWKLDGALFLGALRDLEGSEMKRIRDIMDIAESRVTWGEPTVTAAQMEAWKKELAAAKDEWKQMGGVELSDNELERTFIQAKMKVALAHLDAGRKDKARRILEDIVQEYPKHKEMLAAKALLEKMGK